MTRMIKFTKNFDVIADGFISSKQRDDLPSKRIEFAPSSEKVSYPKGSVVKVEVLCRMTDQFRDVDSQVRFTVPENSYECVE